MSDEQTPQNTILGVGGVVYRFDKDGQPEVLLIKKHHGFWTLPKGQIKPNETDRHAVAREVSEETGITGSVGAQVQQVSYSIIKKGKPRQKQVTYYLMRAQGGQLKPGKKEHIEKARWFGLATALKRVRRRRIRKVMYWASELLLAQGQVEAPHGQDLRTNNGHNSTHNQP